MVKERAASSQRRSSSLRLDQRLWLHERLTAIAFAIQRHPWLFIVFMAPLPVPLMLLLTICRSAGEAVAVTYGYLFACTPLLAYTHIWWERNVIEMARENSLAAVGPLLDMAALTFFGKYKPASAPETPSEKKVFQYLPDLLSRMAAGDGPQLSARQQQTLHHLITSPRYASRLDTPGLRAKVDALTRK